MIYNGWIFLHLNTYKVYTINLSLNASYIKANNCVAESIRLSLIKDSTPLKPPTPSAPSEVSQKRMQLGKWVSLQAFEGAILNRFEVKGSIGFQLGEGLPPHMFGHSC